MQIRDEDEAREVQRTLNADRRQLTEAQRREIAVALRQEGHSERAIGGALGVSKDTIQRDIEGAGVSCETPEPERIAGLDGKSYPARRPVVVAALDADEAARAQRALLDLGEHVPFDEDDTATRRPARRRAPPSRSRDSACVDQRPSWVSSHLRP